MSRRVVHLPNVDSSICGTSCYMALIRRNAGATPGVPNHKTRGTHSLLDSEILEVHNLQQMIFPACEDWSCTADELCLLAMVWVWHLCSCLFPHRWVHPIDRLSSLPQSRTHRTGWERSGKQRSVETEGNLSASQWLLIQSSACAAQLSRGWVSEGFWRPRSRGSHWYARWPEIVHQQTISHYKQSVRYSYSSSASLSTSRMDAVLRCRTFIF